MGYLKTRYFIFSFKDFQVFEYYRYQLQESRNIVYELKEEPC